MAAQSPSTIIEIPPSPSPPPPSSSPPQPPASESEMKQLSNIRSPLPGTPQRQQKPPTPTPAAAAGSGTRVSATPAPLVIDRTLASVTNLAKLLPTGTVLAFQALSPSFANHGACYPSNKYLTSFLLYFCVASCVFFSFTDSLRGRDGKLYYGMATFRGFYVFNYPTDGEGDSDNDDGAADREIAFKDLRRLRIRFIDLVHAFFSAVVFLTVAFSDADVQNCFFPKAGPDARELLVNLPLGAGFLSSIIFMVFPTTRKSIGHTESAPAATAHSQ